MTQKVCVILLGDEKQFRNYKLFKGDLEQHSDGILTIEDLRNVNNASGPEDVGLKLKNFLESRDAIIVVCSPKMKSVVDERDVVDVKLYGKHYKLDGNILSDCFARMEIKKKVVLVSLDEEDDPVSRVPDLLQGCNHFNTNNDDVLDQVIGSIVCEK